MLNLQRKHKFTDSQIYILFLQLGIKLHCKFTSRKLIKKIIIKMVTIACLHLGDNTKKKKRKKKKKKKKKKRKIEAEKQCNK